MKIDWEELYWADWDELEKTDGKIEEIFNYLNEFESFELEELSQVLKLYNNPSGAHTIEFAKVTSDIYNKDKVKFIKALHLVQDEIPNLVYAFRLEDVFADGDLEFNEIVELNKLDPEEVETAKFFFKMYKTICSS